MTLSLIFGSIFGLMAAVTAFLITYSEYSRHFPTGKEPVKQALEIAIFTFIIFIAISILSSFVLGNFP